METPEPRSAVIPSVSGQQEEKIRHLSVDAQAAFQRFRQDGNPADLDPVIFAILTDFIPHAPARPLAEYPGTTLLMEDLGLDSLAITEIVFFTEDLLGISIANEEILTVRTLDDLRTFIQRKAARKAG